MNLPMDGNYHENFKRLCQISINNNQNTHKLNDNNVIASDSNNIEPNGIKKKDKNIIPGMSTEN